MLTYTSFLLLFSLLNSQTVPPTIPGSAPLSFFEAVLTTDPPLLLPIMTFQKNSPEVDLVLFPSLPALTDLVACVWRRPASDHWSVGFLRIHLTLNNNGGLPAIQELDSSLSSSPRLCEPAVWVSISQGRVSKKVEIYQARTLATRKFPLLFPFIIRLFVTGWFDLRCLGLSSWCLALTDPKEYLYDNCGCV